MPADLKMYGFCGLRKGILYSVPVESIAEAKDSKSIGTGYPAAYFVQLGQIENGANE